MSHAIGATHTQLLARDSFTDDEAGKIEAVISRRVSGEPLQYILGVADFYGRDFAVGPGVLIPRHDTETLIDGVKKVFAHDEAFRFLDWGTGSGCLAVTILLEFPNASGAAVDVSGEALSYARENAERWGVVDRAEFGDNGGEFALIVSNPPYIPSCEIAGLQREIRDFEPTLALDGGHDGMRYYRELQGLAMMRLKRGGISCLRRGTWDRSGSFAGWKASRWRGRFLTAEISRAVS